jgi:hypothetical protein
MKELIEQLNNWELLKLFGEIGAIISVIISFFAVLIRDFFSKKLDKANQKEIEKLKHKYAKTESIMNNIAQSISCAYSNSNSRITLAYEEVWKALLQIRTNIPSFIFSSYISLTKQEIKELPKSTNVFLKNNFSVIDYTSFFPKHSEILNSIEPQRPFISSRAWNIFYAYQAFIGRLVFLFYEGSTSGKIESWQDDINFRSQILGLAINMDQLNTLLENEVTAFYSIISYLELDMTNEIQNHLYGKEMVKETLAKAIELSNANIMIIKEKIKT